MKQCRNYGDVKIWSILLGFANLRKIDERKLTQMLHNNPRCGLFFGCCTYVGLIKNKPPKILSMQTTIKSSVLARTGFKLYRGGTHYKKKYVKKLFQRLLSAPQIISKQPYISTQI